VEHISYKAKKMHNMQYKPEINTYNVDVKVNIVTSAVRTKSPYMHTLSCCVLYSPK
jgi:hypothetical protein